MLRLDFPRKAVEYADTIVESDFYSISTPSWEVERILDGKITWDDFSLTFRLRLDREPDVYQTVVQGSLRLEPEDMNWFCAKLLNIEGRQERIIVEADGSRYAVDRYCPHQGGDLSWGWVDDGRFLRVPGINGSSTSSPAEKPARTRDDQRRLPGRRLIVSAASSGGRCPQGIDGTERGGP